MVTVRVCSKLKTCWKSVVFANKVGKNSRYFVGACTCWIWHNYSQLSVTHLVGYLSSHGLLLNNSRIQTAETTPQNQTIWFAGNAQMASVVASCEEQLPKPTDNQ